MRQWSTEKIESQEGKLAIVTGGTDGIGFEAALELVRRGADVVIASDRSEKGAEASERIRETVPEGSLRFAQLNTADLHSVRRFAEDSIKTGRAIDILINNAGIAGIAERRVSPQNFEWHFAANYLGHFALTAQLFPLLRLASSARVVCVSSLAHVSADLHFDDLQLLRDYDSSVAYGQSKLAMLLFARELDRRLRNAGLKMKSIPVHPGGSRTNIFRHGREFSQHSPWAVKTRIQNALITLIGQSANQGAKPLLFAATAREAESGVYYGPNGIGELRGNPGAAKVAKHGRDVEAGEMLWRMSETLSGVNFDLPPVQVEGERRVPHFRYVPLT